MKTVRDRESPDCVSNSAAVEQRYSHAFDFLEIFGDDFGTQQQTTEEDNRR
jgi:hypothetical protein